MTLHDILKKLALGDLSNTSLVEDGFIKEKDKDKVILAIEDGLTQLHSRFTLSFRDVWIQTYKHITYYHLDPLYAESNEDNSSARELYIKDLFGEKFEGGVLKILTVFNEQEEQLPLNDKEDENSFYTPQPTIIQVPRTWEPGLLNVVYQANHEKLDKENEAMRIQLPESLVPALCSYVNYLIQSPINTQEAMSKALESKGNYELICQRAVLESTANTDFTTTNTRFEKNGWV